MKSRWPVAEEMASEDDLYYCYRLLLDREPDSSGWNTWSNVIRQGTTSVATLVQGFISSTEFRDRNLEESAGHLNSELVDLGTFKIYASRQDWAVGKTICEDRAYEPHIASALAKHLSTGAVFVDIGANIGYFSLMAASLVGERGRVLAFEPNPQNCNSLYLSAQASGFRNIELFPFAAAEKNANFLYDNMASNGSISDITDHSRVAGSRVIIRSVVIDEVLRDLDRVDVVKIDIEGAEFRAIQGSEKLLVRHRPVLLSEFSPPALANVSKVSGEEYLHLLINLGYALDVFMDDGILVGCGSDAGKVMGLFEARGASHVDLLATPTGT